MTITRRWVTTVAAVAVLALASPLGCSGGGETASEGDLPDVGAAAVEREAHDVAEEAREMAGAAEEYAVDERTAFETAAEEQLDELGREIEALREEAEGSRAVEELEQAHEGTQERLQALKDSGSDQWEELRSEIQKLIDDLEERYDRAAPTS